ncbi:unnamed protein product [Microthlaspi erraticum]|uniref:F-box domain-containing protein n=1 Tax=Microthlaspi erraticum TaxID=1685480 RepID=A0A6D2K5Q0_9BRAS|nr:unnamed protein product [Microthlaspi erraticum]
MSTAAAFSTNEPLPPNNDPPQPPSSLTTLPTDLMLNILARVTRYHHPVLSRVSKKFRSLVRSSELRMTRSLQGNEDSFYVCLGDFNSPSLTYHWFTLDQSRLVSILFPPPREQHSTALMIGHEIYLVGGHDIHRTPCKSMSIIDSRSGELRQGPSMRVARRHAAVGLVDEKIYVFGGGQHDEHNYNMQVEVFDTKKQTWDVAPNPEVDFKDISMSVVSRSLDRKIYAKNDTHVVVYDPRNGKCEKIDLPDWGFYCIKSMCEIENVIYIYCYHVGLMWYDSKKLEWRAVKGVKLGGWFLCRTTMVEYNGKLAFLRERENNGKTDIWCSMIALEWGWNALEIVGKVEWSHPILSVPQAYQIVHCLGRPYY